MADVRSRISGSLPASRDIDSFSVGEKAAFSQTFSAAEVAAFASLIGDENPIHLDEGFAATTRFGRCIVHGPLYSSLIGTVLGTMCPGPGTILVGDERHFHRPVFVGDTVVATVEVSSVDPAKREILLDITCRNQDDVVVLTGRARTRLAR